MKAGLGILAAACISLFTASATAQTAADEETPKISLMLASRAADNDAGRHHDANATYPVQGANAAAGVLSSGPPRGGRGTELPGQSRREPRPEPR